MWFKSLNIFRVTGLDLSEEELGERLSEHLFVPCKPHEETRSGWVSPLGPDSDYLTPAANSCHLLALRVEKRKVPADHIKMELEERIKQLLESNPEAKITNALKRNLKEEIKKELLPNAFSKIDTIFAYIDKRTDYLYVDCGSRTTAETFASALSSAITDRTISILPVQTKDEPSITMKHWLLAENPDELPERITPSNATTLKDADGESGTIKYKNQYSLREDDNLKDYLSNGMAIADLDVSYEGTLSFTMTEDFMIKSIRWFDEIKEEADAENAGNEHAVQADYVMAEFSTMNNKVKEMTIYLLDECFGGEKIGDEDEREEGEE